MMKKPNFLSSIRAKLFSAVAMLLVAVIMVVSSTYAWFTLSTAPEVTGITTAIGANGSLEMALLPADGEARNVPNTTAGDSVKSVAERNRTWGNLVDMSDVSYGMDKIVLLPSELNYAEGSTTVLNAILLKTPLYGSDGRISELKANTTIGNYTGQNFVPGSNYGFRAVGVSSGMTDRQLAYTGALSSANTATSQAKTMASGSLNTNGSALANIAIKKGMDGDAATFDQDDVNALKAIVNDLTADDGILAKIDYAYMQYLLAFAASNAAGTNDAAWSTVEALIKVDGATASSVLSQLSSENLTIPTELSSPVAKLETTKANVKAASEALKGLTPLTEEKKSYTWSEISGILTILANPDAMTINGFKASEVKTNLGDLVSSVTSQGGLVVKMVTGGGVYADIADHCGDYTASIVIERVEYSGIVLNNMTARMETATTANPTYLSALSSNVKTFGSYTGTTSEVKPLTEFYGYILDLVFRTNAAESNLLLQTDGIDRIYDENANSETMGHGSNMTFQSTSTYFDKSDIQGLMECVRLVFFNPSDLTIVAYARLDAAHATLGEGGYTADLYLCDATGVANTDAVITDMPQNTAKALSVLVYLDGNNLDNSDVAFEVSKSVTGTMNLQFASSANLTPMEYADLHTPGNNNAEVNEDDDTPASYTVGLSTTSATDVTLDGAATTDGSADYTFKLNVTDTTKTYTVAYTVGDSTDSTTLTPATDGTYTIPRANITGNISITVTEATAGSQG